MIRIPYKRCLILLGLVAPSSAIAQLFTHNQVTVQPLYKMDHAISQAVDLNGNGVMDLAVWGLNTDRSSVEPPRDAADPGLQLYRNINGVFSRIPLNLVNAPRPLIDDFRSTLRFYDISGNGLPDLVVLRHTGSLGLYLGSLDANNNPVYTFSQEWQTGATPDRPNVAITFADTDGDGYTDIIGNWGVLRRIPRAGQPDFELRPHPIAQSLLNYQGHGFRNHLPSADMDADGFVDILPTMVNRWLVNSQQGGFADRPHPVTAMHIPLDVDRDGSMDLVYDDGSGVRIRFSAAGANPDEIALPVDANVPFISRIRDMHVADLDGDGNADILLFADMQNGAKALLYRNLGNRTFALPDYLMEGAYMGGSLLDIQTNGRLDIVTAGVGGRQPGGGMELQVPATSAYLNTGSSASSVPAAPLNVRIEPWPYTVGAVRIRYDLPDNLHHTRQSVNIRVTNSRTGQVLHSGNARASDGRLLTPAHGNWLPGNPIILRDLQPDSIYTVSVQFINAAYRTSAFTSVTFSPDRASFYETTTSGLPSWEHLTASDIILLPDETTSLLITGQEAGNPRTGLFKQDASNRFQPDPQPELVPVSGGRVAWGDFSGRNLPDLIMIGQAANGQQILSLYQNNNGLLQRKQMQFSGSQPTAETILRLLDVTGDGRAEVLFIDPSFGLHAYRLEWNADNPVVTFHRVANHALGDLASSIRDIDRADYGDAGEPAFFVIQAQANGTVDAFRYQTTSPTPVISHRLFDVPRPYEGRQALTVGAINTSGSPDVFINGRYTANNHMLQVYENEFTVAGGRALLETYRTTSFNPIRIAISDFDNDGFPDVFMTSAAANGLPFSGFLRNVPSAAGRRTLVHQGEAFAGQVMRHAGALLPLDLNRDTRTDLVLAGRDAQGSVGTRLLINAFPSANTPPGTPDAPGAIHTQGRVALFWNPPRDTPSPAPLLAYVVRAGTAPGATDIRNPLVTADGRRMTTSVPTVTSPEFHLSAEPGTTIHWSVQALDPGGLLSEPLEGVPFTVPFAPFTPSAATLSMRDGSARFVDINGDGKLDILYSGRDFTWQPIGGVYLAGDTNGQRTFTPQALTGLEPLAASVFTFGDIDGDRFVDMIQMGLTSDNTYKTNVYQSVRAGVGFQLVRVQSLPGLINGDARLFDATGDGHQDLVLTGLGTEASILRLYRNTGRQPGSFSPDPFVLEPTGFDPAEGYFFARMDAADYDLDGRMDVIVAGVSTLRGLSVDVFRNVGGRFERDVPASGDLPGNQDGDVRFADLNNDGLPDVVVSGSAGVYMALASRDAAGQIRYQVTRFDDMPALYGVRLAIADITHNGYPDLVISGRENAGLGFNDPVFFRMLVNNTDNTFTTADPAWTQGMSGMFRGAIELADATGNGSADLLISGRNDDAEYPLLHLNNLPQAYPETIPVNRPPSAPSRATMKVVDGVTYLTWDPAADDHTPAPGLRYHVRVSSSDINDNLVRAAALLPSGKNQFVHGGNAGSATVYRLPDMPAGQTYNWQVQAIDQSGLFSEFTRGVVLNDPAFAAAQRHVIRETGPRDRRINLVYLAEGYQANEVEAFVSEATRITDSLFVFSPYREYSTYFNVYAISVPSQDGLVSSGSVSGQSALVTERNTYFNAFRHNFGNAFFITIPDADSSSIRNRLPDHTYTGRYEDGFGKVDALLATHLPDFDLVMMLCKTDHPAGAASLWQDRVIAFVGTGNFNGNDARFNIARHELAHAFGLGDEYDFTISGMTGHPQNNHPNTMYLEGARALDRNALANRIPWSAWIPDTQLLPSANPPVGSRVTRLETGFFEGAQYANSNWFRAHAYDIMRDYTASAFGPINREWIVKAMYGYRWSVPGMKEPFHRLRPIRPIFDHTPNHEIIDVDADNPLRLTIESIVPNHPGGMGISWNQNNNLILSNNTTLVRTAAQLGEGRHTITVRARDQTPLSNEIPNERFADPANRRWVIPANDTLGYLQDTVTWIVDVVTSSDIRNEDLIPSGVRLHPNYPNPFNPTTSIRYEIPVAMSVELAVYDLLGRKLATLVSEEQIQGHYQVQFDASALASGVYVYRLSAGNLVQIRKMTILK